MIASGANSPAAPTIAATSPHEPICITAVAERADRAAADAVLKALIVVVADAVARGDKVALPGLFTIGSPVRGLRPARAPRSVRSTVTPCAA